MNRDTFAYWRRTPSVVCPLVINPGQPSECRLVARGKHVHIYHYTRLDNPKRSRKSHLARPTSKPHREEPGNQPNSIPTMKTPMKGAAKKAATKGAAKGAMKGAATKVAKSAMASKGYAKK